MSKSTFILTAAMALGVAAASAQITWDASQWEAYTPAGSIVKADTEVDGKSLVITPNWADGKLRNAFHNNVPMTYAPAESMIIFKVETEGITFADLKGAQVEMVHAYKENAPEGKPNFYTDKVSCSKTTKNGEGDNFGYFYVNLADNLAKKGVTLTEPLELSGNTNWKDNQRSWIAFYLEGSQLPTVSDYKIKVLALRSANPEQFRKEDGSLSAGMIRDYINSYISDLTTGVTEIADDRAIDVRIQGNCVMSNEGNEIRAYSTTGAVAGRSNNGQLTLPAGIFIVKVVSPEGEKVVKVAVK